MQNQQLNKKVLAVVSDLFFSVKITDAAKRAGLTVELVTDPKDVLAKAKNRPSVIIFDLNFEAAQPLELIAKLKSSAEYKGVSLIGFLSHVQGEAQAGGAGSGMRYGDGALGVFPESAADSEAARGRGLRV